MRLILASASPQRREILASLGCPFEVVPTDVDEDGHGAPIDVATGNALRKARAAHATVAAEERGDVAVLGVDTVVVLDDEIWGKPADSAAAVQSLRRLSGRTHEVVSGFAILTGDGERTGHELTRVTFRALDDATVGWYVDSGEWRERAGGYAIQGRGGALVERIDGDYLNVVGLPVAALVPLWPQLIARAREIP